ncbi:GNAT family N-acetyltransferase [Neobacillus mesonae]|uniref:GNAT family N-acetyltransferase n=1 Tax=Neobacillus mesonae TaxID=1193713 RepID=UPI002040F0A1|nr:GNAT family protein [Neobacillus mesonae]MCM3571052.1 GNAT family N-acetyltransferase [Neobacillus mesonae]
MEIIKKMKEANAEDITTYCIPIDFQGKKLGRLRPITVDSLTNNTEIEMITKWRQNNQQFFTTQFNVSVKGTKKWLENAILQSNGRILFMVENEEQIPIGHVGLCEIDDKNKYCLFDNILRGDTNYFKGGMKLACSKLLDWCFRVLDMETIYLQVLSDNSRAINLYKELGFQEIQLMPLMNQIKDGVTIWVPVINQPYYEVKKYLLTMRLSRSIYPK